jgi:predicted dehydrogenase
MNSNKKIKVAMIGGGVNSAVGWVHEIAMKMDNRFELVSGCFSRSPTINRETGVVFGIQQNRVYPSVEALLDAESGDVDCCVIASPSPSHFDHIRAVLNNGLKVISDKPLVVDLDEFRMLEEGFSAFDDKNVFCVFNYTGYPILRDIRKKIRLKEIGDIVRIMIEMPQDTYLRLKNGNKISLVQKWRLSDGKIDCLTLDLFVHIHSIISFLIDDRPEHVYARGRSVAGLTKGLVDDVDALITYVSGVEVNVWYSKVALGHRNGLKVRVLGSNGGYEWYQGQPEELIVSDALGERGVRDRLSGDSVDSSERRYQRFKCGHPAGYIEAFANYYYDIAEVILTGETSSYCLGLDRVKEGLKLSAAIQMAITKGSVEYLRLASP